MGQSFSTALPETNRREITSSRRFSFRYSSIVSSVEQYDEVRYLEAGLMEFVSERHDYTFDIPDECLANIFHFLGDTDRKNCSLVCRRWLQVDGQNRFRLSLHAKSEILPSLPSLFARFDSVTKLILYCERKLVSISDEAFILISIRCPNLTRLKLRGCREITDLGMEAFALNCKGLKKLSCASCMFGAKGMNAVLQHCSGLEELSVKRLRGIQDNFELIGPGAAGSSLKSVCLKELINGQCFGPLLVGSKKLEILKLIRCLGDWDKVLEMIGNGNMGLTEIHFERLQISDLGLSAISKCSDLEVLRIVKTPECSNSGLVCVAEGCKLLRKLHIDGWRTNRIGDEGLITVAKQCTNLQELVLIGINPTSLSLEALASNCQKLERLAICGSGSVGDAEIACIAAKCVALKKLCIKGCPISDVGIETLARGCPNLVKIKVKKCRGVSGGIAEWLRERRGSLCVHWDDGDNEHLDASSSDVGGQESGVEFHPIVRQAIGAAADVPSGSNGPLTLFRTKFGFFACRNLVPCAFRRWPNTDNSSDGNLDLV